MRKTKSEDFLFLEVEKKTDWFISTKWRLKVNSALIVHGRQDAVVPFTEAKATFDAWDNTSMLVVNGYGHYRLMKNPGLIRKVAEFIGR